MDIATLRRHTAHLSEVWEYFIDKESLPPNRQWGRWLEWNPPERIEEAIKSLAKRLQKPQPMTGGHEGMHAYVTAALIGIRKKAGELPRAWEPAASASTLDPVEPFIERISEADEVPVRQVVRTGLDWSKAREEAEEYQRQRRSLEESDDHK